ncbi:hypothetical protein C8R47DRAFT_811324, partial [Mycena vitilis]
PPARTRPPHPPALATTAIPGWLVAWNTAADLAVDIAPKKSYLFSVKDANISTPRRLLGLYLMYFTTEYFTQRKVWRSKRERLLKVMYPAPVHQPVKPEIRDRTRINLGLGATSNDHRSGIFRHPLSPPDHHVRPHSPPCRPTKRRALYEHGFYSRLLQHPEVRPPGTQIYLSALSLHRQQFFPQMPGMPRSLCPAYHGHYR